MDRIPLGTYVTYKGDVWLVVKYQPKGLVLIVNPRANALTVSPKNLGDTKYRSASVTRWNGTTYVVTNKGNIYSALTGRLMKWPDGDYHRQSILNTLTNPA